MDATSTLCFETIDLVNMDEHSYQSRVVSGTFASVMMPAILSAKKIDVRIAINSKNFGLLSSNFVAILDYLLPCTKLPLKL